MIGSEHRGLAIERDGAVYIGPLQGISYFCAPGIMNLSQPSDSTDGGTDSGEHYCQLVKKDLNDFYLNGFDIVRVWATWITPDNQGVDNYENSSVIKITYDNGNWVIKKRNDHREWDRFICLIEHANQIGMVVDVTCQMGDNDDEPPYNFDQLMAVWKFLADNLKTYQNIYFDINNENNPDTLGELSAADVIKIRNAIRSYNLVPGEPRLMTCSYSTAENHSYFCSHCSDPGPDDYLKCNEMPPILISAYLENNPPDFFLSPHLWRKSGNQNCVYAATSWYLEQTNGSGGNPSPVPINYQEPFRCDPNKCTGWLDNENVFFKAKDCALANHGNNFGGAAWFFHNGHFLKDVHIYNYISFFKTLNRTEKTVYINLQYHHYDAYQCRDCLTQ